jgi:hypothetical protein
VNKNGEITDFTNFVKTKGAPFIFAHGVKVVSAYPNKMCPGNPLLNGGLTQQRSKSPKFAQKMVEVCQKREINLHASSGTSMAAPLVAREAIKIKLEKPHLTTQEIIDELLSRGTDLVPAHNVWKKLDVEIPPWETP